MKKSHLILGFICGFLLQIFKLVRLACVLWVILGGAFTIGIVLWTTPKDVPQLVILLFALVGVHTMTKVIGSRYLEKPFERVLQFYEDKIEDGPVVI